ncbi:hypothetical protein DQ04_02541080 [Trypanosoma grayi]|uniref:hypothetical protein n=1 Tax=Trypanosoma grayi TaxID=71804 RepID=UPI0004F3FE1D|nr:hypothetical protein DQ04_02541080 [Trypanosoma grayi]KEG11519.1 hypothetical protein DQ04_02541080 [Trypanosoma grayi]
MKHHHAGNGRLDEAAMCLEQLREQLNHMRANDHQAGVSVQNFPQHSAPIIEDSALVDPLVRPSAWDTERRAQQVECKSSEHILRQLEARLRRHQESGVKKRGELAYAVGKAHSDMEQLQYYTRRCQLDMQGRLQTLQQLLIDMTSRAEGELRRPAIVVKGTASYMEDEIESSACRSRDNGSEEDARMMSRLKEIQSKLDCVRRNIQHGTSEITKFSATSCSSSLGWSCSGDGCGVASVRGLQSESQVERARADAQLTALKEMFVNFVQKSLDELEQLRSERVEAEEQCNLFLNGGRPFIE